MNIKDIIKEKRLELGLTYEELGNLVGVGKSTVRKWETGMIENMRCNNIIALANALKISPSLIMGWGEVELENNPNEKKLLSNFNKLNDFGQNEAIKRVNELTQIDKYTVDSQIDTIAAHNEHLHEEGEIEKIKQDLDDMDNW
ncbi:helix-turn-helix domain-containing protein [Clostridioides sp. ZZV14-6009]|uniref:helix-turn-helix domain-containing protein n=1 Tax=Clostridioides sp. ZZV14-6009 TaxID=2811487 RepID=UPI001D112252|nr:helix-turn-helix domain-containing protein [Clostridioides sp. ZZV14-6009]